jgi:hypothetical protein
MHLFNLRRLNLSFFQCSFRRSADPSNSGGCCLRRSRLTIDRKIANRWKESQARGEPTEVVFPQFKEWHPSRIKTGLRNRRIGKRVPVRIRKKLTNVSHSGLTCRSTSGLTEISPLNGRRPEGDCFRLWVAGSRIATRSLYRCRFLLYDAPEAGALTKFLLKSDHLCR